ncbi:MAG: DNA mismatch repair endonuclease MutL [Muribaculaceae bacterium]|nr:DNA mismatch repair endonuclease MutL [Muribaculaceae bacterium]
MSDVIKLLPDSVANQIAAGEVIQRPASVIKELVENSVDAGATHIQIILKDAGRTLIQVVDNGCGMSDTDARLAFERHATSKISQAADLFALSTMGFRGEALASIAAIAQVDLRTMRRGESVGTRLIINGSKVESQEPEACQPGSNMMVKNLFFNVPARRKFLKKDSVELSNILREFERLALVNPGLEFTLVHNDAVLHQLLRGSLKQRIGELFGKSLEKQIIPVETDTSIVKITGFVGLPECARKRNALQYFFVNGRNMRHPYFHKAVMQCYEQLIPSDEQPNYFLNFEVAPDSIDVNIHPTKNEIKFENEQSIWQILVASVKESLGKFNAVPSINFDAEDMPDIPAFNPDTNAQHGIDLDLSYNPFAKSVTTSAPKSSGGGVLSSWRRETNAITGDWEKLYVDFTGKRDDSVENIRASAINDIGAIADIQEKEEIVQSKLDIESDDVAQNLMQIKNRYILSPSKSGLMVIDQHRAHVRILYDRYMDLAQLGAMSTQRVIFPEVLQLSSSQNAIMESIYDEVCAVGFDVSYLGDNSWSINGVPSVIDGVNSKDAILQMIESVTESGEDIDSGLKEKIALSMARAASIKVGQSLTHADMEHLMSDLFKLTTPNYTPDGKLVVSIISIDDLHRLFV